MKRPRGVLLENGIMDDDAVNIFRQGRACGVTWPARRTRQGVAASCSQKELCLKFVQVASPLDGRLQNVANLVLIAYMTTRVRLFLCREH